MKTVQIKMSEDKHKALRIMAINKDKSMQQCIIDAIEMMLKREGQGK